jgi:hypothetical protein
VADVDVSGNLAFLATSGRGIVVLDLVDAGSPRLVAQESAGFGPIRMLALLNNSLFAVAGNNIVLALDVSNLPEMNRTAFFGTGETIADLVVLPDRVLLAAGGEDNLHNRSPGRLMVFDTSANGNLNFRSQTSIPGQTRALAVAGSTAFVATVGAGLSLLDLAPGPRPRWLGSYAAPTPQRGMAVDADHAYVATLTGFDAFDVRDPARSRLVARHDGGTSTVGLARSGPILYRGYSSETGKPGIEIIDIADVARPLVRGRFELPDEAGQLLVAGPFLYVMAGAGVRILDLSDPRRPFEAGAIRTHSPPQRMAVGDRLAVVVTQQGGVEILDLAEAAAPRWLGSFDPGSFANDVATANGFAYVATGTDLQVLDLSTPASPRLVARYAADAETFRLCLVGDELFLTTGDQRLSREEPGFWAVQVLDVAKPTAPRSQSRYVGLTSPVLGGSHAFLLNDRGGVSIFRLLRGGRVFLPLSLSGVQMGSGFDARE